MTPKTPWTPNEEAELRKRYPDTNNDLLTVYIDRTESAIAHKAHKLGLKKSEQFLSSNKSGRFTTQFTWYQRLLNWLRSWGG